MDLEQDNYAKGYLQGEWDTLLAALKAKESKEALEKTSKTWLAYLNKVSKNKNPTAARANVSYRYDILAPEFLHCMAMLAEYGAEKYGELNWQLSRLEGGKSPINHMMKHIQEYRMNTKYDHFDGSIKWHLVAIAFNAMMEFWYEEKYNGITKTKGTSSDTQEETSTAGEDL